MFSKWPIRRKLIAGLGLLLVLVVTLAWSGFQGVYSYRSLVKNLSGRASELPLADTLGQQVSELRVMLAEVRARAPRSEGDVPLSDREQTDRHEYFDRHISTIRRTLLTYRAELLGNDEQKSRINDSREEWKIVRRIQNALSHIDQATVDPQWLAQRENLDAVYGEIEGLQALARELPRPLQQRFQHFALEVRTRYRAMIALTWVTSIAAGVLFALLVKLSYSWVIRPLRVLIKGSRRVAAGDFSHRITLDTHDEIAELATAMNDMTQRFQIIRDDLDRQVQERTKQVVRSEQLASVGFLAAGVAHEINNPLASIALCAESLESRIAEVLSGEELPAEEDAKVISNYLRMIQNEAFRCKGITERLLDFSRIGDIKHQNADLRELVQGVIDMVGHLGRYQDKRVLLEPGQPLIAPVNSQEIKQVVLNLITNGLDSLSPSGTVRIELLAKAGRAEMVFTDDGCGMTDEVLKHLFEPFFTRRRCGQGTGLGLSITYRIVADHGGHIDVFSAGPGKGSQFRVSLPLVEKQKEIAHRNQAA